MCERVANSPTTWRSLPWPEMSQGVSLKTGVSEGVSHGASRAPGPRVPKKCPRASKKVSAHVPFLSSLVAQHGDPPLLRYSQELSGDPNPQYFLKKYCRTNGRRTAVQMGGAL